MIYEQLFPLAGGGALGFAVGYALKKVIKFVIVGLGLVALLIGYLENQNWISANWTVIENQTSTMMTQAAHKAYAVTHAQ
ncbi:MAG: FUN14 domain-containing protein [Candidatus Nitrosopolaris sp.]